MRAVPQIALDFVREVEDCKLMAYRDSGGVWTVGVGHVGPEVKSGLHITQRIADIYLKEDLTTAAKLLSRAVHENILLSLTDHQYSALLSFVFNLGYKTSWTIWKKLNAGDYDAVPGQLIRFVYDQDPTTGKMRKVQGLVNRRTAEIRLWSTGEPGSVPDVPSSAATRSATTPPAPAENAKNGPLVTAVVTACTTCGVAVKSVMDAISPFAPHSDVVSSAVMVLATLGAGAAGLMVVLSLMHRHAAKQ